MLILQSGFQDLYFIDREIVLNTGGGPWGLGFPSELVSSHRQEESGSVAGISLGSLSVLNLRLLFSACRLFQPSASHLPW